MLSKKKKLPTREMYVEETECGGGSWERENIFMYGAGVYAREQYKMSSHIDRVKGAAAPFQECAFTYTFFLWRHAPKYM